MSEQKVETLHAPHGTPTVPGKLAWRCFHCDEIFTTWGAARDHFGAAKGDTPGCILKVQLGDERGWLMELRKEQERADQQMERALQAEREVEKLECRVQSLSTNMKQYKPFKDCDSMQDVFNVYDSMEGRALAAGELVASADRENGELMWASDYQKMVAVLRKSHAELVKAIDEWLTAELSSSPNAWKIARSGVIDAFARAKEVQP